jgi:glutamine synthetase type III
MTNRHLYRIELQGQPFADKKIESLRQRVKTQYRLPLNETSYFVFSDQVENSIYKPGTVRINILFRDGRIADIAEASDQLTVDVLAKTVKKYFLCYPKDIKP